MNPRHGWCSPRHGVPQDINQMHPRYNHVLGTCLGCIYHVLGAFTMSWVDVLGTMKNVNHVLGTLPCLGYIDHVLGTSTMSWVHFAKCIPRHQKCSPRHVSKICQRTCMSWVHRPCLGYIDHVLGNNMISWAHLAYRGHTAWYRGYMYWCRGCI